jgi:hypothetical protein
MACLFRLPMQARRVLYFLACPQVVPRWGGVREIGGPFLRVWGNRRLRLRKGELSQSGISGSRATESG